MSTPRSLPTEQRIGLLAWAGLTLLQPVWHAWLFPPQVMPLGLLLAITVIPLLLPLLALRDPRRALLWVGILSLFYFCHGVSEAWSAAGQRWLAVAEIVLTLLLISTLGAGVKRKREPS
ncbi:putative membrane protein [Rhodanobacter sp. TND4EL1]